MMFLLNLGYKWNLGTEPGLGGAILLPCHNPAPRVARRKPGEFQTQLLDPQLYLCGLEADVRKKTCARLAGYPWFQIPDIAPFDSSEGKQHDWETDVRERIAKNWPACAPKDRDAAIRSAIEFQIEYGVTSVILPTPLLEEREDEGESLGAWLDDGQAVANELELGEPLLATVAISESVLNDKAFKPGGFLDALVEQVCSREGLGGVYIVVAQDGAPDHAFQISERCLRAYWQLSRDFANAGMLSVITNFADVAGFAAMACGATAFASGPSLGLRALHLDGFRDEGGGIALPHLYSHPSVAEYRSERDLDKIVAKSLVRQIADETPASAALIAALRRGDSATNVPAWVESKNNIQAAQQHYVQRLAIEGHAMRKLKSADRAERVLSWLDNAEASALMVDKRLKTKIERRPPVDRWREIMEEVLAG